MRRGRPWEAEFINLDELSGEGGRWRVNWTGRTARRGDLVYEALDEALDTVQWVIEQGGDWVEVDPSDARRVIDDCELGPEVREEVTPLPRSGP
ncbi:hypothetical protein [Actinocatenispora comari]|uniref:Uncharacterized protein n=1 Tax=Actinocatenispora comari TaxID=2807577 RepID=A0A8J4EQN6_9ACTN|nr:hypothetical protein [Actinocatenispora comari]GIL32018.1 hypothetical protein NUM_72720 [Actinocatenispora comari]